MHRTTCRAGAGVLTGDCKQRLAAVSTLWATCSRALLWMPGCSGKDKCKRHPNEHRSVLDRLVDATTSTLKWVCIAFCVMTSSVESTEELHWKVQKQIDLEKPSVSMTGSSCSFNLQLPTRAPFGCVELLGYPVSVTSFSFLVANTLLDSRSEPL